MLRSLVSSIGRCCLHRSGRNVNGGRLDYSPCLSTSQRFLNSQHHAETSTTPRTEHCHKYFCSPLDRSVIRVFGEETCDYLQGLVTNDIRHLLDNGPTSVSLRCIYAFMLNTSGRIVADLFIYSFPSCTSELLLEVDSRIASQLVSLLKRYKVRRKVNIESNGSTRVFAAYPETPQNVHQNLHIQSATADHFVVCDPRNYHFGYRVLALNSPTSVDLASLMASTNPLFRNISFNTVDADQYRLFRYQNGIGEGATDFPPESVFPFEANAEILNGVSFQKGCYIGQELTARTFHTGVVRKRMVPIELQSQVDFTSPLPVQNIHSNGKIVGKFRANLQRNGLAVLRFADVFTNPDISLQLSQTENCSVKTWRPFWWPESISGNSK